MKTSAIRLRSNKYALQRYKQQIRRQRNISDNNRKTVVFILRVFLVVDLIETTKKLCIYKTLVRLRRRQTMRDKRYMVTKWHEQLNKEEVRLRRYKL